MESALALVDWLFSAQEDKQRKKGKALLTPVPFAAVYQTHSCLCENVCQMMFYLILYLSPIESNDIPIWMTSIDDCHPVVWRGISSHAGVCAEFKCNYVARVTGEGRRRTSRPPTVLWWWFGVSGPNVQPGGQSVYCNVCWQQGKSFTVHQIKSVLFV